MALWAQVVVVGMARRATTATGGSNAKTTVVSAIATDGHHLASVGVEVGTTRFRRGHGLVAIGGGVGYALGALRGSAGQAWCGCRCGVGAVAWWVR